MSAAPGPSLERALSVLRSGLAGAGFVVTSEVLLPGGFRGVWSGLLRVEFERARLYGGAPLVPYPTHAARVSLGLPGPDYVSWTSLRVHDGSNPRVEKLGRLARRLHDDAVVRRRAVTRGDLRNTDLLLAARVADHPALRVPRDPEAGYFPDLEGHLVDLGLSLAVANSVELLVTAREGWVPEAAAARSFLESLASGAPLEWAVRRAREDHP